MNNNENPKLSETSALRGIPVTGRSSARVDGGAFLRVRGNSGFERARNAAGNGFGGDVLRRADELVNNRSLWSKPPAPSTFVAAYLAN